MPRPRQINKAIIRLSSHPSHKSLCFDSKLSVVVVVIGLMETRLYNLIWKLSLKASFVIFTGSSPSEHIIITLRSQNGPSYTHICRIKGWGGAGCPPPPPPRIFERLKLPQQIIYRRKENLSESPNHQKFWENILVSRFYEQFSRNRRNLGHFRKFEKISNSQNMNIIYNMFVF